MDASGLFIALLHVAGLAKIGRLGELETKQRS